MPVLRTILRCLPLGVLCAALIACGAPAPGATGATPETTTPSAQIDLPDSLTSVPAAASAEPMPLDPCTLLSSADVVAAIGTLASQTSAQPSPQFGGYECTYVGDAGVLAIALHQGGEAKVEQIRQAMQDGGVPSDAAPDFGERALIAVGQPGTQIKGMVAVLVFAKGDSVLHITLLSNKNASEARALATDLGKQAQARMPEP